MSCVHLSGGVFQVVHPLGCDNDGPVIRTCQCPNSYELTSKHVFDTSHALHFCLLC